MRLRCAIVCAALSLCAVLALADEKLLEPLDDSTAKLIEGCLGDPSAHSLQRVARDLDIGQAASAIYRGTRTSRLVALEAMAQWEAPEEALPFFIALMQAADRAVSSRAAHGLSNAVDTCTALEGRCLEMPLAQRREFTTRLVSVVANQDLDPDLRVVAWRAMDRLLPETAKSVPLVTDGLSDKDTAIRRMALSLVNVPSSKDELLALAARINEDEDPAIRGQAAAIMCENALAHGVAGPSPDLEKLLLQVLSDKSISAEALAGVLYCIHRFDESRRTVFVEKIGAHPDSRLLAFWKQLENA